MHKIEKSIHSSPRELNQSFSDFTQLSKLFTYANSPVGPVLPALLVCVIICGFRIFVLCFWANVPVIIIEIR